MISGPKGVMTSTRSNQDSGRAERDPWALNGSEGEGYLQFWFVAWRFRRPEYLINNVEKYSFGNREFSHKRKIPVAGIPYKTCRKSMVPEPPKLWNPGRQNTL